MAEATRSAMTVFFIGCPPSGMALRCARQARTGAPDCKFAPHKTPLCVAPPQQKGPKRLLAQSNSYLEQCTLAHCRQLLTLGELPSQRGGLRIETAKRRFVCKRNS